MNNRQKEDKRMKDLKNPKDDHSAEISKLINQVIASKHKVYVTTDWHLWKRACKDKPECHKHKNFTETLKNVNAKMTENDILINLGDLVDGEFKDKESLKSVLQCIPGKKILVLGDNDLFDVRFYKSCGFDYVVQSFVWSNIIFTHMPIKNDYEMNVHGHIHGYRTYWVPYTNMIDVAALGGRTDLIELDKVIASQKSYAKTIKECPDKFEQESVSLFDEIMIPNRIYDPFDD